MRRMLIIWKIVLVILVVLADFIYINKGIIVNMKNTKYVEGHDLIMKNMERKAERNAKRKIRHYNRGI